VSDLAARLRRTRAQLAAARLASMRNPDSHELRVRAFALAATVRNLESLE
jgi:hypothetical protein